jgi:uncharacterized protein with HEPN domain
MPDSKSREWRFYIGDMLRFCEAVLRYTEDLSQAEFIADNRTYDATLRNLELIGEAARQVPDHIRENHDEIPWRLIIATRNRLIHAYLGIDDDVIWSIIRDDIPELTMNLKTIDQTADY